MKTPILGGDGMFGHELLRSLSPSHDMRVTLRQPLNAYLICPRSQGKTPWGGGASSLADMGRLVAECGVVGAATGSLFVFKGPARPC